MSLRYREKIAILTEAMTDAEKDLGEIVEAVGKTSDADVRKVVENIVARLRGQRLRIEPSRVVLTPQEKAEKKFARQFDARMNGIVSWLKLNGVKKGAFGMRRTDGARVKFTTDPMRSPTGVIIGAHFIVTDKHVMDAEALLFKPDVTIPPEKKVSLPKPAARALKAAPAKRTAAAK